MNTVAFLSILTLHSYSTAISWKDQVLSSGRQPAYSSADLGGTLPAYSGRGHNHL